jgi:predicted DNA-binding transcriptional regulator AlpA
MVGPDRNKRWATAMKSFQAPVHSTNPDEPAGQPIPLDPNALLYTAEAAFLLGLSPRTLETLRLKGDGPSFIAVTKKAVRYRRQDIMEWIRVRKRQSTSETGQELKGV